MKIGTKFASLLALLMLVAGLPIGPMAAAGGGGYQDVHPDHVHSPAIEALDAVGLLADTDCAEDSFCPDEPVQRWVAAVWLGRAVFGAQTEQNARFGDLGEEIMWAAPYIEILVDEGILEECTTDPLGFCPQDSLTRSEMATVLARAFRLPPADDAGFADLEGVSNHDDINALASARVTAGCSTDPFLFCPTETVTRGQMATLLARAAGLVALAPYRPVLDPSSLPIDSDVRVGALDNGFTYYLRHNDQPGRSVTLRLVVKAGSINEPEPGRGIAHFLEHMLFHGTEAYTEDELNATIRSLGAELGPDVNAYVGYDQTVYELTVAAEPAENVDLAIHVLSQMAHAALIDPEAVIAERGVVLDELRFRTAGRSQINVEFDRIYTKGTPYEGYNPIGTVPSIEEMTADDLREYYDTWYVPSNMAIVAVGDVPIDDLQARIAEHFGPIEPGAAPPFSLPEVTPDPEASYYLATNEEQAYSYISLDYLIPSFDYGTAGGERLLMLENLIRLMMEHRLEDAYYRGELAQVDSPRFITFNHNHGLRYYGTNWQGDNLDTASTAYLSVMQTAHRFGFTEDDVTRAADAFLASLKHQLESFASTGDQEFADTYVAHFLFGVDVSHPQERHDRLAGLLNDVTAAELTEHYRWLMDRSGPIFIAVGPDADSLPTVADLQAAVEAAAPSSAPPTIEPLIEALLEVPEPVAPTASRDLTAIDGVEWEFDNGARVVFVHSDIEEATVRLRARSLGGWSTLYPGSRALAPRATEAVFRSGFGDLTKLQMDRFLGDNTASLNAVIGETTEGFDGAANPEDLETLFQLLHLAVTAPRVDDLAFGQARNSAAIRTSLAEVNPAWQAWVAYNEARFGAEWHYPVATREQVATMNPQSLLDLYQDRLGKVDDMVLAVVGDTSPEVVERLARLYIATLPSGAPDTYVDRHLPAPKELVQREVSVTDEASAVLEMYHENEQSVGPSVRVNAHVLQIVLDDRLTRLVREQLGASYVTYSSLATSLTPRPTVYSDVVFTSDPSGFEDAYRAVLAILADLVSTGPTPEELEQALTVARADFDKASNERLLRELTNRLHRGESDLLTGGAALEQLNEVTAATVRALAADLYDTEGRVEIIRRPPSR